DTQEIRTIVTAILQDENYDVVPVATAAELQKSFGSPAPDVILLDMKLPDGDGLELLPQLKKQWPDTEVIILTGYATYETAVEATKRGAYHYLTKPFVPKSL